MKAARDGALALLAAMPEAAALLDVQGGLVALNQACRAALGPALPSGVGLPARLWFQPAQHAAWDACVAQRTGRLTILLADDLAVPRPIEASLHALPLDGLLLLRLTAAEPRTETDRLALVGRLAGGVAHDFNNLLGIMLGATDAARRAETAAALATELAVLDAAAERGAGLVRQLLAFARQQVLAPRVLALNARIAAMSELLPRLLGAGVTLETLLEEPGRHVLADPSQLDRVLLNLAVNAGDAMGGQGHIRIRTGHRLVLRAGGEGAGAIPPGRYATITVEDSGPGIPPEILAQIFEPFFTTRPNQGGTGLGLATVQGVVAQSGGHILAESPPEGGARFTILLPRHEGEAPGPAAAAAVPARAATILLVDDEPALLRLATQSLTHAGHTVLAAEDGYAALDMIEAGARPDLLATDVAMPGMDGMALARAAQRALPGLGVLLLSGYAARTLAVDWQAEGWAFLAKPYGAEALCGGIAGALANPTKPEHNQN